MPYNKDAYLFVKNEFDRKREAAVTGARERREMLEAQIPELAELDTFLASLGPKLFAASINAGGRDVNTEYERIHVEMEAVSGLRADLLGAAGYPADHDAIRYECEKCGDTGFEGLYMCECFKRALAVKSLELSGIGSRLLAEQSFDTFSLEFYGDSPDSLDKMKRVLDAARGYAKYFGTLDAKSKNLLLIGATGLGKTHLTTAIAREIVEGGNDVVYVSSAKLLEPFERERFNTSFTSDKTTSDTDRFYSCDLLIIDDLGTEVINKFTVSVLYNVINSRVSNGQPMIISTNLAPETLRKSYEDRITSRLFGEFRLLGFVGHDVRAQKKQTHPGK